MKMICSKRTNRVDGGNVTSRLSQWGELDRESDLVR